GDSGARDSVSVPPSSPESASALAARVAAQDLPDRAAAEANHTSLDSDGSAITLREPASDPADRDLDRIALPGLADMPEAPRPSTEGEPPFSFVATHIEPLLLRILESITVPEPCERLAQDVRSNIRTGLNWYEFAAVLEDIIAIIATSVDH